MRDQCGTVTLSRSKTCSIPFRLWFQDEFDQEENAVSSFVHPRPICLCYCYTYSWPLVLCRVFLFQTRTKLPEAGAQHPNQHAPSDNGVLFEQGQDRVQVVHFFVWHILFQRLQIQTDFCCLSLRTINHGKRCQFQWMIHVARHTTITWPWPNKQSDCWVVNNGNVAYGNVWNHTVIARSQDFYIYPGCVEYG